ncbi:unnamed protein product [Microthlaspi erraticum]|uniref:Uncharacterized protein n=1 Tax=Microthlaspi erraticum TaxID=1685480 RepID=A0A6D2HPB2_9BRAS|nr:unnamed protein product [Microthlaspi erraticum]
MGSSSSSCSSSASSMAHLGSPLVIFINQLVHLFSFLFTLSFLTPSSFGELQSQTPLAHSHYYRVIPLLGSPFFPHSHSQTVPQSRHILCIRFFHPLIILFQIGLHLKPFSLALLDSPSTILLCEARLPSLFVILVTLFLH